VGLELGVVVGGFVDESTTFYFLERWRVLLLFCMIQNYKQAWREACACGSGSGKRRKGPLCARSDLLENFL
jgi:hypothetical protein